MVDSAVELTEQACENPDAIPDIITPNNVKEFVMAGAHFAQQAYKGLYPVAEEILQ